MDKNEFEAFVISKIKLDNKEITDLLLELLSTIKQEHYLNICLSLNDVKFSISLLEFVKILKEQINLHCLHLAQKAKIKNFQGTRLDELELITLALKKEEFKNLPKWVKEA
ncbi:hypothetical protein B6S12_07590 [Helicobacter valdiviensis]|uniref:Uncharacterized protein n=1 Tax=Helicobacter valdiviensis TaxID=1458358 RepID=A0A2W6MT41_9HELI|nr:hypothetical protein [Helicobacter valdiviensis]PZT47715.1 hypothetical protein B6S12_07590 [Helicobacter valdiviensis]